MIRLKTRKAEERFGDFSAFYAAHERFIRGLLFQLVGRNDLDDLVQQSFIRCWEKRDQYRGEAKLRTWIARVAVNLCHDHWRRNKVRLTTVGSPDGEGVETLVDERSKHQCERRETRQVIESALEQLSFEHRSVIALAYFQDMSIEEIADSIGEAAGTVKSRLHYAKAALRGLLEKMGVEV